MKTMWSSVKTMQEKQSGSRPRRRCIDWPNLHRTFDWLWNTDILPGVRYQAYLSSWRPTEGCCDSVLLRKRYCLCGWETLTKFIVLWMDLVYVWVCSAYASLLSNVRRCHRTDWSALTSSLMIVGEVVVCVVHFTYSGSCIRPNGLSANKISALTHRRLIRHLTNCVMFGDCEISV